MLQFLFIYQAIFYAVYWFMKRYTWNVQRIQNNLLQLLFILTVFMQILKNDNFIIILFLLEFNQQSGLFGNFQLQQWKKIPGLQLSTTINLP